MNAVTSAAPQKTCFVVMGFGEKIDLAAQRQLDLDKTYRIIIKPAVEKAGLKIQDYSQPCGIFPRSACSRIARSSDLCWKRSCSPNFPSLQLGAAAISSSITFRDRYDNEVDFVIENQDGHVVGIEVKDSAANQIRRPLRLIRKLPSTRRVGAEPPGLASFGRLQNP